MTNQISKESIEQRLIDKNIVLVSGLPFSGKTTTVKELIKDDDILIELPKEINDINELEKFRKKLSELSKNKDNKIVVEGRNYVVELFLGKIKPRKPSLKNPHVKIDGNALTFHTKDVMKEVGEVDALKILEYSLITTPNYSTYIPKLIEEAKELYKSGKLDEILPIVVKFKEIYSRFPSADIEGEEAVIYPLLSLFNSPEELKGAWLKLSDTWKELIYYRIDSALRILPGESKKIISEFLEKVEEKEPKLERWNGNYTPEFLETDEYLATILLNNKNVVLKGPIKTGKSAISKEVVNNLLSRDKSYVIVTPKEVDSVNDDKKIVIIDYHSENYETLRHIASYLKKGGIKFAILTDDLTETLNLREPKYVIYSIKPRDFKEKLTRYTGNRERDLSEYIYNVIFEEDPNLIRWYSPLIATGLKYGFPLPLGISRKILEYTQRKIEKGDIFTKWFSVIENIPPDIKDKDEDIKKFEEKSSEILEFLRKNIIDEVKSKNLFDDLLFIYSHTILKNALVLPVTKLDNYFLSREEIPPITNEIFKNVIQDIKDYLQDGCKELPENIDILDVLEKKSIVSEEDISSAYFSGFLYYVSIDKDYSNVIKTILKSDDVKCLIKALRLLLLYSIFGERKAFKILEEFIYKKIMDIRDEELVRYYVSLSIFSGYRNIHNIRKISELSPMSKVYSLLLLPKKRGDSPLEILANVLSLDIFTQRALDREDVNGFIKNMKKFQERLNLLKGIVKRIDKEKGGKIASTVFKGNSLDLAIKVLQNDLERYNTMLGLIYYHALSPEEDLKDSLKLTESLILPYYNYLVQKNSKALLDPNEAGLLFNALQVRLANSLISGNVYDYKNILNDFIDYLKKYFMLDLKDVEILAKMALRQEIKTLNDVHVITLGASALLGNNVDIFFKAAELLKIDNMNIAELVNNPLMAELKIIYSLLKGKNVDSDISFLNQNGIGPIYRISHKLLKENDKYRYIASLILFF